MDAVSTIAEMQPTEAVETVETESGSPEPVAAEDSVGANNKGEADTDAAKSEVESEAEKKKINQQRAWERVTKARYKAEAERDFLQKQIEELKGSPAKAAGDSVDNSGKPKRSDFADDEAFLEALVEHKATQKAEALRSEFTKTREQESTTSTFKKAEDAVRKEIGDYDEVIADAADIQIPQSAVDAILTSDNGPRIRYFLAKNPDVADALSGLSSVSVIREIGKIEAKLELEAKQPAKVTTAPEPIKPISGKGNAPVDPRKMSEKEYWAWKAKQKQ